jgi:hypothetical protein
VALQVEQAVDNRAGVQETLTRSGELKQRTPSGLT